MNIKNLPLNPYESPSNDIEHPKETSTCLDALRGPSLGLLVLAGMQVLLSVLYVVIVGLGSAIYLVTTVIWRPEQVPDLLGIEFALEPILGFSAWLAGTVSCVFILRGARSMRCRNNYRRAKLAAILSCVSFLSPMMYFGIPFGIWAWVVLRRPAVRAEFDRSPESPGE